MKGSRYTEIFEQSLERVMRKEGFLDSFYDHFTRQSDEIAVIFTHKDMNQLKHKLDSTLHILVEVAEGQPGSELYIEMLGRIHNRLGVKGRHFTMWREALLDTVSRFDDEYDDSVAEAWSAVIDSIVSRMHTSRISRARAVG